MFPGAVVDLQGVVAQWQTCKASWRCGRFARRRGAVVGLQGVVAQWYDYKASWRSGRLLPQRTRARISGTTIMFIQRLSLRW
ncbi:hypothetical protein DPMN_139949 [Dreissena polymorpha]|uniref:Uncharacterized protein n=1 Tax=Dreissena polymorpha TaxID=45954 RepID=A0A9D4G6P5_DREPO|nr:hypothetical protein DPMN_139949 [Dreissena polymorpha]